MDTKKVKTAINEFQNAAAKVKPFTTMMERADELWTLLQDFDETQIETLASRKTDYENAVSNLQNQIKDLQAKIASLDERAKSREADLNAEMNARIKTKTDTLEADYSARRSQLEAETEALRNTSNELIRGVRALEAQKAQLENQISQLKKSFHDVGSALNV